VRSKCNNQSPISHSHYQHGLQENAERKERDLQAFNELWAEGERKEKYAAVKPEQESELAVSCGGGGYLPKGVVFEEEQG